MFKLRCQECTEGNQSCWYGSVNVYGELQGESVLLVQSPGLTPLSSVGVAGMMPIAQFNGRAFQLCHGLKPEDRSLAINKIAAFKSSGRVIVAFDQARLNNRLKALGLPLGAVATKYSVDEMIAPAARGTEGVVPTVPTATAATPSVSVARAPSRSRRPASTARSTVDDSMKLPSNVLDSLVESCRTRANVLVAQLWSAASELADLRLREESLTGLSFGEYPVDTVATTFQDLLEVAPPANPVDRILNLSAA